MSTQPRLMESQITSLLTELHGAVTEVLEERIRHPGPMSGDWFVTSDILDTVMGEGERDLCGNTDMEAEIGLEIPRLVCITAWTRTLVEHIRNSTTHGDEPTLELLDILQAQIQKRRAELTNTLQGVYFASDVRNLSAVR